MVAKVAERLAVSKKEAQKFEWKDLISGSSMSWRLGNNIRLRYQTGLQLRRSEHINRVWEKIKQNIETSANVSLGPYEPKQHKPLFEEECLLF